MGEKTASVGHFQIPTAPAALTVVAQSGSANTLGSAVSFGNAPSTLFITGVTIGAATTQVPTYIQIQILVAAGIVGSVLVPYGTSAAAAASVLTGYRAIYPPIPVASGAAITVKSASSVASAVNWGVSLECIAQANVVDDGVAVATVTTLTNLPAITANWLTAAGINADAITAAKIADGAIDAATFAAGAINAAAIAADAITAAKVADGTIDAATFAAGAINAASIAAAALNGKGDWLLSSGYTAPLTAVTTRSAVGLASANLDTQLAAIAGFVDTEVASVLTDTGTILSRLTAPRALLLDNIDAAVSSRLATAGYTAPDNASITAIKAKTDSLTFTVAGFIDSNILKVNSITVTGNGQAGSRWNP